MAGAAAIVVLEFALVAVVGAAFLARNYRLSSPSASPQGVVIPSPVPNPLASRFRELPIPKPGGSPYARRVGPLADHPRLGRAAPGHKPPPQCARARFRRLEALPAPDPHRAD